MALPFTGHVPEELWVDLVEGRADIATAALIDAHLMTGCEKCATQYAYWSKFLGALQRSRAVAPSTAVLQRVFDLFDTLPPRPSVWAQVVAHLVSDSRQQLIPAGARSAGATSFNLMFDGAGVDVSLWCEGDVSSWNLTGQVLPTEVFWSVIAISGADELRVELNDDGEFRLPNLAPGQYQLTLRGAERELIIPDVVL